VLKTHIASASIPNFLAFLLLQASLLMIPSSGAGSLKDDESKLLGFVKRGTVYMGQTYGHKADQ
jgi:hypothetical protein